MATHRLHTEGRVASGRARVLPGQPIGQVLALMSLGQRGEGQPAVLSTEAHAQFVGQGGDIGGPWAGSSPCWWPSEVETPLGSLTLPHTVTG